MYIWKVWKNNRFAGYVSSSSQFGAYLMATEEYGQNVWVEKAVKYRVVYHPNNQDHFATDSQPA